jgi:predicted HNH restriction endonuclease
MSRNYKKWTNTEIEFIVQNPSMIDKELALKLSNITGQNITQAMVRRQRRKSGVTKVRGRPRKNPVVTTTEQLIDNNSN